MDRLGFCPLVMFWGGNSKCFRVVSGDYGLNPMISFETKYSSCCFFLARHAEGVHHWLLGDSVVRVGAAGT